MKENDEIRLLKLEIEKRERELFELREKLRVCKFEYIW